MSYPTDLIPYTNYIILALVALQVFMGYRKGLVYQVFNLLGVLAAILVSWYFSPVLAAKYKVYPEAFAPFTGTDLGSIFYTRINTLCWYALLFVIVMLLLLLLKPLMKSLTNLPILKIVNHLTGAVFSLIPALVVWVLVAYFFGTPLIVNGQKVLDSTVLGPIHNATQNVITLTKQPYMTESAIQKLISNSNSLTQEDVQTLWDWLLKEDADPEVVNQFLTEHTTDLEIPKVEKDQTQVENNTTNE